ARFHPSDELFARGSSSSKREKQFHMLTEKRGARRRLLRMTRPINVSSK
ncbi:unnamed protein product, partial [Rotaria magnacalcarata]